MHHWLLQYIVLIVDTALQNVYSELFLRDILKNCESGNRMLMRNMAIF